MRSRDGGKKDWKGAKRRGNWREGRNRRFGSQRKAEEKMTDRLGGLEKRPNTSKCDKSTQDGFVLPGEGRLHLINNRAGVLSAVQVAQDVFKIRN